VGGGGEESRVADFGRVGGEGLPDHPPVRAVGRSAGRPGQGVCWQPC